MHHFDLKLTKENKKTPRNEGFFMWSLIPTPMSGNRWPSRHACRDARSI